MLENKGEDGIFPVAILTVKAPQNFNSLTEKF